MDQQEKQEIFKYKDDVINEIFSDDGDSTLKLVIKRCGDSLPTNIVLFLEAVINERGTLTPDQKYMSSCFALIYTLLTNSETAEAISSTSPEVHLVWNIAFKDSIGWAKRNGINCDEISEFIQAVAASVENITP